MNTPRPRLSFDRLGLKADRLLLPIDLAKCPAEIFPWANGFTKPFESEIVLLHVMDRRMSAPQNGGGEIDLRRTERHMERLGREFLRPTVEAVFRVRIGIPHEEILAEARDANIDLLLLPILTPSLWRRWAGFAYGETVRNLVVGAPCRVFVVDVRTRFNCFRRWAKEEAASPCTV